MLRILLVIALLGLGGSALAAGDKPDDTAQAKKLFVLGTTNFELGRYQEALQSYLEAYQKKPLPGFLFNIGLCHRKLGRHADAVAAFEKFLAEDPKAPNRADAEAFLAEERAAAAAEPPPTSPPNPPPPVIPAPLPPAPAEVPPLAADAALTTDTGSDGLWLWAAAGGATLAAALAAGTVAAVMLLSPPSPTPPEPLARVDLRSP